MKTFLKRLQVKLQILLGNYNNDYQRVVDELGLLKANISHLKDKEQSLKLLLVASSEREVNGKFYRATIVRGVVRETLDIDAAREKLTPQFIVANTKRVVTDIVKVVSLQS